MYKSHARPQKKKKSTWIHLLLSTYYLIKAHQKQPIPLSSFTTTDQKHFWQENSFKMVTVDGATQWFVLKSSSFFTKKKPESPHQCKIQSAFSAKSSKQEINTHYGHWYRPICQAYFQLIDNKLCWWKIWTLISLTSR